MNIFQHNPISLGYDDLLVKNTPSGRRYCTPEGLSYPSITTVLGAMHKEGLQEWKQAVGEEEANRICHHAATRGTAMHSIVERYLNNDYPYFIKEDMPHTRALFNSIKPHLDNNISEIYMQECPLYSDHLEVAGRVDLVAKFAGKKSIVDFKTARRPKTKEEISSYFQQATAYAIMYEERTGVPIGQIVILMAVDDSKNPLCYIEKRDNYVDELLSTLKSYKENYR